MSDSSYNYSNGNLSENSINIDTYDDIDGLIVNKTFDKNNNKNSPNKKYFGKKAEQENFQDYGDEEIFDNYEQIWLKNNQYCMTRDSQDKYSNDVKDEYLDQINANKSEFNNNDMYDRKIFPYPEVSEYQVLNKEIIKVKITQN